MLGGQDSWLSIGIQPLGRDYVANRLFKRKDDVQVNYTGEVVTNPVKAIRKHCIECSGWNSNEVAACPRTVCYLWPFRFGKNPYRTKREYTEEQRKELSDRFKAAREKAKVKDSVE